MPFNLPGTLIPFYALLNPRLLLPSLAVRDIRYLNFAALKHAGYRGAIFDKDNCLTRPHDDELVPEIKVAWSDALRTFGPERVLIVSNSAGTRDDAAQLQAESVSHHLGAPVLLHAALKPSYACAAAALAALPDDVAPHELVVVGDRIFTDVVLAHRLAHPRTLFARIVSRLRFAPMSPAGDARPGAGAGEQQLSRTCTAAPLAVWTTGVWTRESMGMRSVEAWLVRLAERWVEGARERREALEGRFVRRALDGDGDGHQGADKAGRGWFSWVRGALPKLG